MIIYFAAPLFTSSERSWNSLLAHNLQTGGHTIYLPQEFCKGLDDPSDISNLCLHRLSLCGIVLVNCDGVDVDAGTAMEFGVAIQQKKRTIAYRTDFRRAGDCNKNMNLMIATKADVCLNLPLANYSEVGRAILGVIDKWKSTE